MRHRRRRTLIAVAVGVVASIVFASLAVAATVEGTNSISAWTNPNPTVTTAESLTFRNSSTTTSHGVAFDAPPVAPNCTGVPSTGTTNWQGSCTFSQAGSYPFHCTVHPGSMTGTVTVTSAGPGAPIVSASATGTPNASDDTKATLGGSVDPNGLTTEYWFEYGTPPTYGTLTTKVPGLTGGNQSVSADLTGLTAGTTYHFRLVAKNSSGETQGTDHTFTTFGPPLATTSAATPVSSTGATLRGTVNPHGHATTYFFKWGETTSYGQTTSVTSAGSGTSSTPVSAPLTGLSPGTTYHFLLVANNASGTDEADNDQMFTTLPPDTTDPQTTITGKPADPTNSSTVEFKYVSNEPGSTFECKMDGEPFTACASTGKTYTGLGEGPHTFQVRATDPSLNTDESPASYSFSVVLPAAPPPEVTPPTVNPPPTVEPPPKVVPDTTMTLKPKAKTKDRTPTFKFKSTVAGATFKCTLDGKALKPCRSPLTTKKLSFGRHTLKVSAVAGGASDPTPATSSFKVLKP
jgi:plastocyanin